MPNQLKLTHFPHLQAGSKDLLTVRAPAMPDGTAGFVPGPWCEKRAAELESRVKAERVARIAAATAAAVAAAAAVPSGPVAGGDVPHSIVPTVLE